MFFPFSFYFLYRSIIYNIYISFYYYIGFQWKFTHLLRLFTFQRQQNFINPVFHLQVLAENFQWKTMKSKNLSDSTERLIESLHATRQKNALIINPDYLDDEKLPEEERTSVLKEIFNRNIREKQLGRIISHLTPVLDSDRTVIENPLILLIKFA